MSKTSLGEFEKLMMLAVLHLSEDAYGATIIRELEERTGRATSAGAVYVALRCAVFEFYSDLLHIGSPLAS